MEEGAGNPLLERMEAGSPKKSRSTQDETKRKGFTLRSWDRFEWDVFEWEYVVIDS